MLLLLLLLISQCHAASNPPTSPDAIRRKSREGLDLSQSRRDLYSERPQTPSLIAENTPDDTNPYLVICNVCRDEVAPLECTRIPCGHPCCSECYKGQMTRRPFCRTCHLYFYGSMPGTPPQMPPDPETDFDF